MNDNRLLAGTCMIMAGFCGGCMNTHRHILQVSPESAHWKHVPLCADMAFGAAIRSCTDLGFDVFSIDENQRRVWMSGREGAFSFANIAIFIEEAEAGACKVGVVAQDKHGKTTKKDWTRKILAEIQARSGTWDRSG